MRVDELPGPGNFSGSNRLVQEVVKAISFTEIADSYRPKGSGPSEQAVKLLAFFQAAVKKVEPLANKKYLKKYSTPSEALGETQSNSEEE